LSQLDVHRIMASREMLEFSIRPAVPQDYDYLGEIMFEAVRDGAPQYTEAQRLAWVPETIVSLIRGLVLGGSLSQ